MVRILIANQDIAQISNICNFLTNDKTLEITGCTNGMSALNKYDEIKPDIFILYTNLTDISFIDIINTLSLDINEKNICNIILICRNPDEYLKVTNIAKLYKVFLPPFTIFEVFDIVEEMSKNCIDSKIDQLFLKTNIKLKSTASDRVREALKICCHSPNLLCNLNDIFNLVSKSFQTDSESIRSSFRTSLKPLNSFKEHEHLPNFAILNYFEKGVDVTPKEFLDVSTYYLMHMKKNR